MAQSQDALLSENFAGGVGSGSGKQTAASILTGGASGLIQSIGQALFPETDPVENVAAEETAQLLNEQFTDWQNTFEPVELQALQQVSLNNPAVLPNALQEADANVSGAYGQMPGILSRQNRALGINPTPQQTKSTNRMINVNQSLATAGAENTARAGVRQMDEELLLGSTPNPNIAKGPMTPTQ